MFYALYHSYNVADWTTPINHVHRVRCISISKMRRPLFNSCSINAIHMRLRIRCYFARVKVDMRSHYRNNASSRDCATGIWQPFNRFVSGRNVTVNSKKQCSRPSASLRACNISWNFVYLACAVGREFVNTSRKHICTHKENIYLKRRFMFFSTILTW